MKTNAKLRGHVLEMPDGNVTLCRTFARKSLIRGLDVCAVGLDIPNVAKRLLIHSVPFFNLGGLEVCLEELSPPKASRGDGTDSKIGRAHV